MASRIEEAVRSFREIGCCFRAMMETYGPQCGLTPDEAEAADWPGSGRICGAATASIALLGLRYRRAIPHTSAEPLVKEFADRFADRCGTFTCRAPEATPDCRTICPDCVQTAATIFEDIVGRTSA